MKRVELELEHRYKDRFVGRHKYKQSGDPKVIGSSRAADLRLLGEGINGVHALLEFDGNEWTVADMGSEQGTWVKKKPIIRQPIQKATTVRIGGHDLRLVPRVIDNELFVKDYEKETGSSGTGYHQVIVRKAGYVIETKLLNADQDFEFSYGGERQTFKAPTNKEWVSNEFGEVVVQQRFVETETLKQTTTDKYKQLWDPNLKVPTIVAIVLCLIIFGLVFTAPSVPNDELKELKPEKNKYTRIIYDSKFAKKKREQAVKLRKNIQGRTKVTASKNTSQAPKKSISRGKSKAPKFVSKIRASGLSRLVGKISKRASKNAKFIASSGRTPDSVATGAALATPGSLSKVLNKSGKGKSFKLKSVSTNGKAGGSNSYRGVGGLSAGNIGNGSVGILEEETEIQGGLDRDVISRIIRSQLGQIRYCYERQLSANPDMYGKVLVKFTIGAAGNVDTQKVGLSTLKSAMVEGCMLRRIAGWKFPKPKGGTSVLVTYPFLFKSTN